MELQRINAEQAQQKLINKEAILADIRDEQSFNLAHIADSYHLTNESLPRFVREFDLETPVIVCCYHGVSSLNAANYLIHQGFEEVYSLDGGFEHWRRVFPFVSEEK